MSEKRKETDAPPPRFIVAADGRNLVRLDEIACAGVQRYGAGYVVVAFRRGESWQARVPTYGVTLAEKPTDAEAQLVLRRLASLIDPHAIVLE